MKQRFTQLIAQASQARRVLISSFAVVAVLAAAIYAYAAVGVTVTGGTTLSVSADLAANATLTTPGYTQVGTITITERVVNDISSTGDIIITPPSGWRFQVSTLSVNAGAAPNENRGNVRIAAGPATVAPDGSQITIPVTNHTTDRFEQISISGIAVQALNGGNIPGTGNIGISVSPSSAIDGLPTTVQKSISQVNGVARGLAFRQQPTNTAIGATINPAPQVAVVDQFGNPVVNGTGNNAQITLAIGDNTGGGTLSGTTTVTASGGIATFNGLSIDLPGAGYTLRATSTAPTFPAIISSAFNVNNQQPTITNVAPACISQGDAATTLTITGTNFGNGAVVLINGVSRAATVSSRTSLTTSVTAAELASAGTLSIVVRNPSGPPHNGLESTTFSKTVVPLLTPGEIAGAASVCVNSTGDYSIAAVAGATSYQWTVVSGPATITAGATTPTVTLAFGEDAGTVVLSVAALNACGKPGAPVNFTVAVNAFPEAEIEAGGETVFCEGGSVTLSLTSELVEGASYQWQLDGNDIEDATETSFVADASGEYRVVVTSNGCATNSNVITVTENPLPEVTLAAFSDICESDVPFALTGGLPAGGTYSGPGVTDGVFNPVAAGGDGTYTITYTFRDGNGCVNSATQTLTVKPQPVISVESSVENSVICQGQSLTLTASGADSYVWSPATGLSATNGAEVIANPTTTTDYVVYGITNGCQSEPVTVRVTVNPLPNVTITPTGPTEFCDGNFVNLVTENVEGYDYEWYDANNNLVGESSTLRVEDTGSYYVTITTNRGCSLTSEPVSVIVAKLPDEASISAGTTTFCQNGSVEISANLAPDGQEYEYVWEFSNTTNEADFAPIPDVPVTANSYIARATGYYRVKVSDVTEGNVSECFKTSQPIQVTVLPQPTADITSSPETQCQVASGRNVFTVTGTYSGGPGTTGTWSATNGFTITGTTRNTVNGVTTTTTTVTAPASFSGTATVTLLTTNPAAACNPASDQITLTVQPQIAGNAITGTNTYCHEATATALGSGNVTGGNGSNSYRWEQSIDQTTWDLAVGTNNAANYTPSTANVGIMHYRRVVTSGTCTSTSNTITVTVNPNPTVNAVTNKIYCNGEAGEAITFGSPIDGVTYSWSSSANVGFGTGGTGNIPAYTATNTGTAPVTATIRVRASANNCQGPEQTFTVTVNPTPTVNTIANRTHCHSDAGSAITFGSPVSGVSYSWTSSANVGFGTSGTGNIPAYTATSTATAPVTATITVRASANNCQGPERTFTVTVNPTPRLSSTLTPAPICSGSVFSYTPTSATEGASFSWTRITPSGVTGSGNATGTGPINQTLTNSGTAPVDVTYQIITRANGCASATQNVVVRVNPTPGLSSSLTPPAVCSGSVFSYTATSATTGTTFSWSRAVVSGISNAARTNVPGNVISETLVNTTASAINVVYVISMTANGCTSTQNVTVSVSPNQVVSFTGLNDGDVFYTGQGNITLTGSPTNGTFSGPGVSGTTFSPCAAGAGTHTITYTRTTGSCSSTVSKTVNVRESVYTVVVTTNNFPVCRGQNTDYTAQVYRDIDRVIYPYMTNANGQPVNAQGQVIADNEDPAINPEYVNNPAYVPANTPEIIKQNAHRYFEAKVILGNGELVNANDGQDKGINQFTYRWTRSKSDGSTIGDDARTRGFAGLSATDWVAVWVSPKNTSTTCTNFNILSSRIYFSVPRGYTMDLNAVPAWCFVPNDQSTVTLTANLGALTGGWEATNVRVDWYIRRNGVADILFRTTTGASGSTLSIDVPRSTFQNGDQVYLVFSSVLDSNVDTRTTCEPKPNTTTPITITINQPATVASISQEQVQCVGGTATFTVNVSGTGPFTYQWYKRPGNSPGGAGTPVGGSRVSSSNTNTLTINNLTEADAGLYYVVVSGLCPPPVESLNMRLNITPLPTVYDITSSATSYCAGSGVTIGLSGSDPNTTYNLLRNGAQVATVTRTASQSGAFDFPGSFTAGTYTVRAITVASQPGRAACPRDMSGSITVAENPLPLAIAATGGSYCEVTTEYPSSGAMVTISNSQSGVAYQLLNSSGQLVGSSANGTGGEITLGPVLAGTYSIRGTNGTTGCTTTVGQATVIEDKRIEPKGDIIITNEAGEVIESKQLESGKLARFTASNTFEDNGDAISYTWYTGDGEDGNWVVVPEVNGPVLTIQSIPGGTFAVRVDVVADESACYTVYAGRYTTVPAVPLPVEIIYFTAAKQGNNVLLEWATASEENNTGFEVQVSQDGFNFRKLDFVPTKNGNTVIKQVYQYNDKENGKRGTRYYRLKQIDEDGRFEYFTTKAVTFSEVASKVKAFPNPFTTKITLDIAAENSGQVQVTMWNAVGRQLMEQTVVVEEGFNTVNLDIRGDLPHGVYFLRVYLDGKMHQIKMLRE